MRFLLSTFLVLVLVTATHARVSEELSNTFQTIDGIIIKVVDDKYLLDIGSANGVRSGDLISVMAPQETILNPSTGKVFGQIDQVKAFLRIIQIKPDFSWAKRLSPATDIRPTDPVRRFGEVPAILIDQSNNANSLFNELQIGLPQLSWQPLGVTKLSGPGFVFTYDQQFISVHDDTGTLLGVWPQATQKINTAAAETSQLEKTMMIGPKFKGKAIGLSVADFDSNGVNEIVVMLNDHIEVGSYKDKTWIPVAHIALDGAIKPLTLDCGDINGDRQPELLITAVRSGKLTSQVLEFDGTRYQILAKDIPWYWRVMDLPGETGVILGQAANSFDSTSYAGKPFRVLWRAGTLEKGSEISTFSAPSLHGSQPFKSQEKTFWAWLNLNDNLTIFDDEGHQLWRSKESYGGGEAYIDQGSFGANEEVKRLFIRSRIMLQDEVLVLPQNDGLRNLKNRRKAEKNRLIALRWNGYDMEKVWESPTRDGYLADFAYADIDNDGSKEYLLIGSLSTETFSQSTSALFLWNVLEK